LLCGKLRLISTDACRRELTRRRSSEGGKGCLEAAMLNRTVISIVDDDQLFRESMRKLIMLLGYTVEEFPSAADFLASRLLRETACLVTDVHMPGMTGVELHGRLINLGYAIPTILVTAYPDEVVRDRALKNGVVCYLSKPVDDQDLERCLRSALKR
jgi:FixJ family two-component response regulator